MPNFNILPPVLPQEATPPQAPVIPAYGEYPSLPTPQLPTPVIAQQGNNPFNVSTGMQKAMQGAFDSLPQYAKPASIAVNTPYLSNLDQTLRYTDPELGFNPFDLNLEDKYARAHPIKNFGNNLVQFGGRFLGAAAEAIATIPIVINAIGNTDFSKMYDNPVTNGINDLLTEIETQFPTYQTNYERDHPVLKYLNIFDPTSFFGTVGSTINNLGYTAGAIAGTLATDAIITAATGGTGLFPALAAQGAKFTSMLGRASRLVTAAPKTLRMVNTLGKVVEVNPNILRLAGTGAATLADDAAMLSTNAIIGAGANSVDDILRSPETLNIIQQVNGANNFYKIRDAIKYNTSLAMSAAAEGAFEASEVYNTSRQNLIDQFYNSNGRMPNGDELGDIDKISKESADITMAANVALLYLSNRMNWGSLFKPTSQALLGNTITGWGKNIGRSSVERTGIAAGKIGYGVVTKTPETTIGKILLNGESILRTAGRSLSEGGEEATQFTFSEASLDYAMRKYNAQNTGEVVNFMDSFVKGIDNTLSSNEGWANIMGGFVGGIVGGGVVNRVIRGRSITAQQRMQQQADVLNQNQFGQVFDRYQQYLDALNTKTFKSQDGFEGKIEEATTQMGLAKDHKVAIENSNIKQAKDIQEDMSFNYWNSAAKNNVHQARIEELDAVKDLEGESFESYWGIEYTPTNKANIDGFINQQIAYGENIKNHRKSIDRIAVNPYDRKNQALDYAAYESYKDEMVRALSNIDTRTQRIKQASSEIKAIAPTLDINKAVEMTSVSGMRAISEQLTRAISNLQEQENAISLDNQVLSIDYINASQVADLQRKRQKLEGLRSRVNAISQSSTGGNIPTDFSGQEFVNTMRDLFNLHDGINFEINKYLDDVFTGIVDTTEYTRTTLTDDNLADALQKIQDVHELAKDKLQLQRMYNYLLNAAGQTEYTTKLKEAIVNAQQKAEQLELDIQEEESIRQQEYEGVDHPEEMTTQERIDIRNAAQKIVNQEELNEEEQQVADKYPETVTEYVRREQRIKERIDGPLSATQQLEEALGIAPEQQRTQTNRAYTTTTPEELFLNLYPNSKYLRGSAENIYELIFNTPKEEIGQGFTAQITTRDIEQDSPVIYRNVKPGIDLQRSNFTEVIQVNNNNTPLGELRPPDSLYRLDEDGNPVNIFQNGVLSISPEQYADLTGNSINTYSQFKQTAEAYYNAYNALKQEIASGNTNAQTVLKYFNLELNNGSASLNAANQSNKDTLLKDVDILNKAVFTVRRVMDENGTISYVPELRQNFGISQQEIDKVLTGDYQTIFGDIVRSRDSVMVAVFPIAGEINNNSFVRARLAKSNITNITENTIKVVTPPFVFEHFTIAFRPKQGLTVTAPLTSSNDLTQQPQYIQDAVNSAAPSTDPVFEQLRQATGMPIENYNGSNIPNNTIVRYNNQLYVASSTNTLDGSLSYPDNTQGMWEIYSNRNLVQPTSVQDAVITTIQNNPDLTQEEKDRAIAAHQTLTEPAQILDYPSLEDFIYEFFLPNVQDETQRRQQARFTTELFRANAEAWAQRTGRPAIEYLTNNLRFGIQETFTQQQSQQSIYQNITMNDINECL